MNPALVTTALQASKGAKNLGRPAPQDVRSSSGDMGDNFQGDVYYNPSPTPSFPGFSGGGYGLNIGAIVVISMLLVGVWLLKKK